MKQRDKVLLSGCTQQQMLELEETIEGIRANMDYINDSINECQTGIMAMEESKVSAAQWARWAGVVWDRWRNVGLVKLRGRSGSQERESTAGKFSSGPFCFVSNVSFVAGS